MYLSQGGSRRQLQIFSPNDKVKTDAQGLCRDDDVVESLNR